MGRNSTPKFWTAEEGRKVREMAAEGYTGSDIAVSLGRTVASVASYCARKNIPVVVAVRTSLWTDDELNEARRLFDELNGKMMRKDIYVFIGRRIGRPARGVEDKLNPSRYVHSSPLMNKAGGMGAVPPEVLRERDEAMNYTPTLTARWFGDPPPSRSALAQRNA